MSAERRKAGVNVRLRGVLSRLPSDSEVPFVCECEDPECLGRVYLTLVEFDRRRSRGDSVRLHEHARNDWAHLPGETRKR